MSCGNNDYTGCPSAGYPTPPRRCACGCGGSGGPGCACGNGNGGNGGNGSPGGSYPVPGGPGGSYPVPMTVPQGEELVAMARQFGAQAIGALAQHVDTRKLCGPWKPGQDGLTEYKLCCTPKVGKAGVKVSACLRIERPYDPWADQTGNGGGVVPG